MKLLSKIIGISLIAVSVNSFASMQQCAESAASGNAKDAIQNCKPYANNNIKAAGIVGGAYAATKEYDKSVPYLQKYIAYYKNDSTADKLTLAGAYTALGNMYYFGQISKDTTKGLEYITKGAELGNPIAQKQLGDIYAAKKVMPQNIPLSYEWYTIATVNGDQDALRSSVMQNLATFQKQYPYCIALGQDNVAQAYYQGIGGLDQSTSTAVTWLEKAQETDPSLSIVNLDLAKMQHNNGDDDAAFKAANAAVSQPYAPAFQYLGAMYLEGTGTSKDLVKAYAYLKVVEYYYNNPDKAFWEKFKAPCRPNYEQIPSGFGLDVLNQEMGKIDLNAGQKVEADKMVGEIKMKVEK